jgi:gamma-glutamyl hydrolase
MQKDERFKNYKSYIMSAYVKYIEAAGAQVIPITVGESEEEIMKKLNKINGVLFPGGDGDNYDLGNFVFQQIKKFNDDGQFFPAWGTCLGYENMVAYTADAGLDSWGSFDLHEVSLPLYYTKKPYHTRMYEGLGLAAYELHEKNMTYNSHNWGIAPKTFETDNGLNEFWDVTAISFMPNGTAFTASIEAKHYPIFGT